MYARRAVDDDRRRMDADLDVSGRAGLAVDQADRPRGRGTPIVNHDVEVLALGGPVAGPGQSAAPVADDQRPLVVREPRLEREGFDREFADEVARGEVHLGDRVPVGRGHEEPRAIAGDRHPARDRIPLLARRLDENPAPGDELIVLIGESLDISLVGTGEESGAIGRPDQPPESGAGLGAQGDARPRPDTPGIGEEDLGLVQDREEFAPRM